MLSSSQIYNDDVFSGHIDQRVILLRVYTGSPAYSVLELSNRG